MAVGSKTLSTFRHASRSPEVAQNSLQVHWLPATPSCDFGRRAKGLPRWPSRPSGAEWRRKAAPKSSSFSGGRLDLVNYSSENKGPASQVTKALTESGDSTEDSGGNLWPSRCRVSLFASERLPSLLAQGN